MERTYMLHQVGEDISHVTSREGNLKIEVSTGPLRRVGGPPHARNEMGEIRFWLAVAGLLRGLRM
jgi:hypothetical protein